MKFLRKQVEVRLLLLLRAPTKPRIKKTKKLSRIREAARLDAQRERVLVCVCVGGSVSPHEERVGCLIQEVRLSPELLSAHF